MVDGWRQDLRKRIAARESERETRNEKRETTNDKRRFSRICVIYVLLWRFQTRRSEVQMKLLSMKIGGVDRAGIVIGSEVLDVTALWEIIGQKGEWIEAFSESANYRPLDGPYRDALDLYTRYDDWLHRIVRRLTSD
jgi:hypothetical protein